MIILVFPAQATEVEPFNLSHSTGQLLYVLSVGSIFNGSVSATGSVRVWMNAPNGEQVINLGLIDVSTSFGLVAQQNGTYILNFENDLQNTISVTFSYQTTPELFEGKRDSNPSRISLDYLIIPIFLSIFGSALILLVMRRKNKTIVSRGSNYCGNLKIKSLKNEKLLLGFY